MASSSFASQPDVVFYLVCLFFSFVPCKFLCLLRLHSLGVFFHIFFRSLIFWIFSICGTGTKPIFYSPGLSLFASSFVLFLAFHVSFQTLLDIYNLLFRLLTNLFALFCWYFYLCSFVLQLKKNQAERCHSNILSENTQSLLKITYSK